MRVVPMPAPVSSVFSALPSTFSRWCSLTVFPSALHAVSRNYTSCCTFSPALASTCRSLAQFRIHTSSDPEWTFAFDTPEECRLKILEVVESSRDGSKSSPAAAPMFFGYGHPSVQEIIQVRWQATAATHRPSAPADLGVVVTSEGRMPLSVLACPSAHPSPLLGLPSRWRERTSASTT